MLQTFFYDTTLFVLIPVLLALFWGANVVGYRWGERDRDQHGDPAKNQVGTIEAALLGLLGLLLGFTYSMASSRYEARKSLVGEEVNAIRTAATRAQLLPPEHAVRAEGLIRAYLDARIEAGQSADRDRDRVDAKARQLQQTLWDVVSADLANPQRPEMTSLFVEALNAMADSKTRRDGALADHVPVSVLTLVFLASPVVFGMVGYSFGLAERRGGLATGLLALLIGLVVMVVLDLDRPRRGLVRVSQQTMIRLRDGLDPATP